MPADVIDQLEMLGRLLDDVAPPVTLGEITHLHAEMPTIDNRPAEVAMIEIAMPSEIERRPDRTVRFVAVAAAVAVIVLTAAYIGSRDEPSVPATDIEVPSVATVTTSVGPVVTVDPMVLIAGLERPPGEAAPDVTFRAASPLGDIGVMYVYDSRDGTRIWTVITLEDGNALGGGYYDRETVDRGQAYGIYGQPGYSLLTGLAPIDIDFSATVGDIVLTPDVNGVWFTVVPADLTMFTMSSNLGSGPSSNVVVPIIGADGTSQTTVAVTAPPITS